LTKGPRFTVDPDPPIAGQPATITYHGDEDHVAWGVIGGRVTKQKVPPRTVNINSVPSGERLGITDDSGGDDSSADWPIVEQNERKP